MKQKESDKAYMHWLYQAVGMGNRKLIETLMSVGTPSEIYEMAGKKKLSEMLGKTYTAKAKMLEAAAEGYDVMTEYGRLADRGIFFVIAGEEAYPRKLAAIPDAPSAIYYVGRLPDDDRKTIAVIGARNCSEYGKAMARQFGEALAGAGVQVVSGMARGIDGIGQQAALDAGGYSLGVLGCGVDICYPPDNKMLYERLIEQGGICSEYPPGIEPRAALFPPRNRIISGMCDGVLVVEAKERSGTLITVDMALEQGREVYAVPGRITDRLSDGCNRLIRQGAVPLLDPEDLITELAELKQRKRQLISPKSSRSSKGKKSAQDSAADMLLQLLPPELGAVYHALELTPRTVQEISCRLPDQYRHINLSACLMRLCMEGLAEQASPGCFNKKCS